AAVLTAPSVSFTSTTGTIGSAGQNMQIAASNVTANTAANVFITDSQALTGNGVSTGANFNLTDTSNAANAMTLTNTINATGNLNLSATGLFTETGIAINNVMTAGGNINLTVSGHDGAGAAYAITEAGVG